MTVQAADSFLFEDERYALFDVSDGPTLSCKRCAGIPDDAPVCTANWKGYIATYEVREGILRYLGANDFLGKMGPEILACSRIHRTQSATSRPQPLSQPGAIIPFTGHVIITQDSRVDFFDQLTESSKALELAFYEGLLDDVLDLAPFVDAMRAFWSAMPRDDRGRLINNGELASCANAIASLGDACSVHPRGTYGERNLTARLDAPCVLCGNAG